MRSDPGRAPAGGLDHASSAVSILADRRSAQPRRGVCAIAVVAMPILRLPSCSWLLYFNLLLWEAAPSAWTPRLPQVTPWDYRPAHIKQFCVTSSPSPAPSPTDSSRLLWVALPDGKPPRSGESRIPLLAVSFSVVMSQLDRCLEPMTALN